MPENHLGSGNSAAQLPKQPKGNRLKRLLFLGSTGIVALALVMGAYLGWQYMKAKQLASQYAQEAEHQAEQSTRKPSVPADSPAQALSDAANPSTHTETSGTHARISPQITRGSNSATTPASNSPSGNSASQPDQENYQLLMKDTYNHVLQTMDNVKANTLALQNLKISLSAYKGSILASKSAFQQAQAYVQANPPLDSAQLASYQNFLAGITLASRSMDVVLDGIKSLNTSSLYAARSMGKTARDQVVNAYQQFR